jgi:hypothetical protein
MVGSERGGAVLRYAEPGHTELLPAHVREVVDAEAVVEAFPVVRTGRARGVGPSRLRGWQYFSGRLRFIGSGGTNPNGNSEFPGDFSFCCTSGFQFHSGKRRARHSMRRRGICMMM